MVEENSARCDTLDRGREETAWEDPRLGPTEAPQRARRIMKWAYERQRRLLVEAFRNE